MKFVSGMQNSRRKYVFNVYFNKLTINLKIQDKFLNGLFQHTELTPRASK